MLRIVSGAIRAGLQMTIPKRITLVGFQNNVIHNTQQRNLSLSTHKFSILPVISKHKNAISSESLPKNFLQPCETNQVPTRTLIKFSLQKGKRKSVKAVLKRFKRLHWGGWIRTLAGRRRYHWCKSSLERRRSKQHFTCNAKQSWLLDTMVTSFWRRPKYYIDDPYTPYHTREYPKCKTTYNK